MKRHIRHIALLIAFWPLLISGQNQAANWYFGSQAGLNFSNGFPVNLPSGQMNTDEGCSTISDKFGNLLFYSDGITIWNSNHNIMQNGSGLLGNSSSTQSALIIPKPNDDDFYYIFTADDRAGSNGLRYSEINMTLDGGQGGITSNKNILLETPATEKITAVEHYDGERIWVISHRWNSNEFIAYLVSNTGVNTTPIVSASGSVHSGNQNNTIGYLKASPNREKIVCVQSYDASETQLFDFEATTGIVSNPITIANYATNNAGPYGCEFSPDSKLLYVTEIDKAATFSRIHQYDITQPTQQAIIDSDIIVGTDNSELGALQQAIDGKIYVARKGKTSLGVINDPNTLGLGCGFFPVGVSLGINSSQFGLPPFVQSYFYATNIFSNTCFGDTTEFNIDTSTIIDTITWDFGDPGSGANNTSNLENPTHVFSSPGDYEIIITIDTEGEIQTIYRTLVISDEPPVLNLDPLIGCEDDNGQAEFNLLLAIPQFIIDDNNITVSFHEDLTDAEDGIGSISNINTYFTSASPTTLYLRLQNSIRGDCYSISVLDLIAVTSPTIEETAEVFFCENTNEDFATITVGPLDEPLANYSFLWLESLETTSEIQVVDPGLYTVRITLLASTSVSNPDGCYADRVVTVVASNMAIIDAINIINKDSAEIIVSGLGDYEFALDNINGPYQNSNIFIDVEAGLHTVYVRDINGCGIVESEFSILGFPKFFTPNNDGKNDRWQVYGVSESFQSKTKIKIFNRYGKLIKELSPLGEGWDGTFNGEKLPVDDYWFEVLLEDGRVFVNHFTLKR